MTKQDALNMLFEETPTIYIMESFDTPDFFEFNVNCGGDTCTYRIYKKDGKIYEK